MTKTLTSIFISICLTLSFLLTPSSALQFNENGEFTIVQFTDFHYCEDLSMDDGIQATQRKILELVKPDLAVISGDGLAPEDAFYLGVFKKHGVAKRCWEKMTNPFIEYKIPYAYTLGNHDGDGDLTNAELAKLDLTNPYSLKNFAPGLPDSPTFYIPVYSGQVKDELAANIWIMDSGRRDCQGTKETYGCLEQPILDWYNEESANIKAKYGEDVHHIAFFHVPIPEYTHVFSTEDFYGQAHEVVCCPTVNSGFFDLAKKNGDISAMFVGHDHSNNFGGVYEGIELVYGQNSGHGSYGGVRGARVIKLKETYGEDGRISVTRDHYIIYENGTIASKEHRRLFSQKTQKRCYPNYGISNVSRLIDAGVFEYVRYGLEFMFVVLLILTARKVWKSGVSSWVSGGSPTKLSKYEEMQEIPDLPEAVIH